MRHMQMIGVAVNMIVLVFTAPMAAQENPTTKPVPREAGWIKRHEGFNEIAKKGGVDLLFLGDSITDAWGGEGHHPNSPGTELYQSRFLPLKAANFGISGDRTQHVLWRLQHGELDGIQPRVVMLMIGTNNMSSDSAESIAAGVTAIVQEIHKKSPKTKVLLLGIFPRAEKADNMVRGKIKDTNAILAKLDDGGKTVKYLDIGAKFLEPDGSLSPDVMPDFLHLSAKGYQIWADAVQPELERLMKS
jgi:lysophospholipase L1-like esterase